MTLSGPYPQPAYYFDHITRAEALEIALNRLRACHSEYLKRLTAGPPADEEGTVEEWTGYMREALWLEADEILKKFRGMFLDKLTREEAVLLPDWVTPAKWVLQRAVTPDEYE